MNELTIRAMTSADVKEVAYVHWKSWQETYAGLISEDYLLQRTLDYSIMRMRKDYQNTLVAVTDGEVAGFLKYGPCRNYDLMNTGEVYAIYVLQKYQGKGIGYQLMNHALTCLRAYPVIALWVLKGNDKAVAFYQRFGFEFDGAEMELELGSQVTELRLLYHKP